MYGFKCVPLQENGAERFQMASKAAKGKKSKKVIEIIPENAEFEENIRSFGDETPSDDTGEQDEISNQKTSNRKRKKIDAAPAAPSSKGKESGVSGEQCEEGDQQTQDTHAPYTTRERKKTAPVWKYLVEFKRNGEKWARCKLCQTELKRGSTSSTSSLNRHVDKCKIAHGFGLKKQAQLQFQPGDGSEVTIANFKYDHAEMRKTVSHYIMVKCKSG